MSDTDTVEKISPASEKTVPGLEPTAQQVSPLSLLQTTGLDGLPRWHLQVSAQPSQLLRLELPQDFYPRLAQEQTGLFVLELVRRDSVKSQTPEKQSGRAHYFPV